MIELLVLGHQGFLVGRVIDQPVLPFAGLPVVADRCVERGIAAETAVHVDHVLVGHAETLGNQLDLVGVQIALVQRRDLALCLAQVEEQFLLVRGGAHLYERPGTQDVLLYRSLDPPHGIGGETEALVGLEPLHRLHQADIALRDDLGNGQSVAAIAHGYLGHEPEMAGDEVMCGVAIVMLAPALGEHVFLLGFQHRKFTDLGEVSRKAGFSVENRQASCTGHSAPSSGSGPRQRAARQAAALLKPVALRCSALDIQRRCSIHHSDRHLEASRGSRSRVADITYWVYIRFFGRPAS